GGAGVRGVEAADAADVLVLATAGDQPQQNDGEGERGDRRVREGSGRERHGDSLPRWKTSAASRACFGSSAWRLGIWCPGGREAAPCYPPDHTCQGFVRVCTGQGPVRSRG